ncbi:hypothetical protein [Methylobacterium oryzisoli]|uniref:hypothetical protein n=1 Tax=Methylobacterium oryzisoli TaxID=3385502 RepID=UPI0038929060
MLAILIPGLLGTQPAASQSGPPDSADILRADAYIAEYSKALGGRAIVRRDGQSVREIEPGQLLHEGDVVEIVDGRPRISIKRPGRDRPFYLPDDGSVFRVAPRRMSQSGSSLRLPDWVLQLFERSRLTHVRSTLARGSHEELDSKARTSAAACQQPADAGPVIRPAVQILAADRTRITIIWQNMPVGRVELRGKTGPILSAKAVTGRSAELTITAHDRDRIDRIGLYQESGRLLMDVAVRFAEGASEPASDEVRLVGALQMLKTRCARHDARTLEAMSRIADLRDRSLAATVAFEAMSDGDVRW